MAPREDTVGMHAPIRFLLVAKKPGAYLLRVRAYIPGKPARGMLAVSLVHPASERDVQRALAQELLAEAEFIRLKGNRKTYPQALEKYGEVISLAHSLHSTSLLRSALTGKARLLMFRLGRYREADHAAEESSAIPSTGNSTSAQGLAWKTLSSAEYFLGEYSASIAAAKRALTLYRETHDRYWQGILLGNMAYTYREMGDTKKALVASEASLRIARSINDWFGVDFNLETLGTIHLARGEYQAAFEFYNEALDTMRIHPYPVEQAATWNGMGKLDERLDDVADAEAPFQHALRLSRQTGDAAGEIDVLDNLGDLALLRDRPRAALAFYRRGFERAKSLGLPRQESFLLGGMGRSFGLLGRQAKAEAAFDQATAISSRISQDDSEARAFQGLGDLWAGTGNFWQAATAYRQAYRLWTREGNRGQAAIALASLARLSYRKNDPREALSQVQRALSLIESARVTLANRDLRTSYFASKHSYYELAVDILMRLHRSHPSKEYDLKAFEMAERARARTLLDTLTRNRSSALTPASPVLNRKQWHVREQLQAAYGRLQQTLMEQNPPRTLIETLRRRIEKLLESSDEIDAQLRAANPLYAAVAGDRPTNVARIQRRVLGPHSALLEYWLGARRSYLWIIRKRGFTSVSLPPQAILAKRVKDYRQALLTRAVFLPGEGLRERLARLARADAQAARQAASLGRLLLGPALRYRGLRDLYIVPDGPLDSVPFAALRVPTLGRSPSLAYAIARYTLVEEPSASVLLRLIRPVPAASRATRIAVFADPVYSSSDPRVTGKVILAADSTAQTPVTRWVSEAGMAHLPRLRGSRGEALAIASLAGPRNITLRLGFSATPQAVSAIDWSRYRVAHFATHAMLSSRHPAFSGIVLSLVRRNGKPEDGVLWLSEVYSLHMPVSLVMLSGCRTAEGEDIPGEGLMGLARAFFVAGARSVGGSLWSVEDEPTRALMVQFYRNLLENHLSAAASLRAAQLALAASKHLSAPYDWAGFVLQGAPDGK